MKIFMKFWSDGEGSMVKYCVFGLQNGQMKRLIVFDLSFNFLIRVYVVMLWFVLVVLYKLVGDYLYGI